MLQEKKTTIMTKRTGQNAVNRSDDSRGGAANKYEYTIVHNTVTDEVYTAAKASSIGSTDKRSQNSSDSIRKRDYMAITQPTMNQIGNGHEATEGGLGFA